jgi:hypothetical protein
VHLGQQRILTALATVPAMTSGLSPTRRASTSTLGRITKRPSRMAARAARTPGAGTPDWSRNTRKNAPPPLSARQWMP